MATLILDDASVVINSVDLSDHVKSVTIEYGAEMGDDSVMADNTRSSKGGLKTWSIEVTFLQDFAASEPDATLFSLVGVTTTIVVKPTSAAVSATNPSFTGTGTLESYPPIGGSIGDMAETTARFVASGDLARATS